MRSPGPAPPPNRRFDRRVHRRVLWEVLAVNVAFFAAELAGGIAAGSLALIADAGHLLADMGALGLALLAAWFASRPPDPRRTYGFVRAEILAALANGSGLAVIAVYVLWEAVRRLGKPPDVDGPVVLALGVAGLGANLYSAWRLRRAGEGLNLRAAMLHMAADAAGSVGVIVSGALTVALGWRAADPAAGAAIAVLIGIGAWGVVREAGEILLEAAPSHIDLREVREALCSQPGVLSVHDLHVWTLTSGYVALSAHVVAAEERHPQGLLVPLREMLYHRFGIGHATLQLETPQTADEPVHCVDDPRCLP